MPNQGPVVEQKSAGSDKTKTAVPHRLRTWLFGYDVFISHTGSGLPYAEALSRTLTEAGWVCFLDRGELHAGIDLQRSVATALERSSMLIIVVSQLPFGFTWPRAEMQFIQKIRPTVPVIPVLVPGEGIPAEPQAKTWCQVWEDLSHVEGLDINLEEYWNPSWGYTCHQFLGRLLKSRPETRTSQYLGVAEAGTISNVVTPNDDVLKAIENARSHRKVRKKAKWALTSVLLLLVVLVTTAAFQFEKQRRQYPDKAIQEAIDTLQALGFDVKPPPGSDITSDGLRQVDVSAGTARFRDSDFQDLEGWANALQTIDRYGSIRTLDLTNTRIPDLRPAGCLRTVVALKLQGCPLKTLEGLECWESLEVLDLSFQARLAADEMVRLEDLPNLRKLYLAGSPGMTIGPELLDTIQGFDQLQYLTIDRGDAAERLVSRLRSLSNEMEFCLYLW